MAGLMSVSYFLVALIFSLILFVLWGRIILRYYRVSALHPVTHAIARLTNPLFVPLERLIYLENKKRLPRYDWICLAFIACVEAIKFILLGLLAYKIVLPFGYLLLFIVADMVVQPCNLFFYALLLRVIMSWVNPQGSMHPAANLLNLITNPLVRLGQTIIPNISGFDFGPFVIMIILKVITLFISAMLPLPLL